MLAKHVLLPRIAGVVLLILSSVSQAVNLPSTVLDLLKRYQIPSSAVSAVVTDLATDKILLAHNANAPRNPASVMKLVTSLAALELVGPAYSWQTHYFLNGKLENGVLDGDLVIKGHGDPYLVTEQFWLHLRALRELGLHKINGNLLIDNSAFSLVPHDPAAFDKNPTRLYNLGPSATMVNFNASRFKLVSEGSVVRIKLDPPLDNIIISDQLRLKQGECLSQENGWEMTSEQRQHRAYVTFSGYYKSGCKSYDYRRVVLSADAYLFGLFKYLWSQLGGEFSGGYAHRKVSAKAEPFYVGSGKSLAETIVGANKYSNNLLARQLLLTIAAEADNTQPATRGQAILLTNKWLENKGINPKDVQIDNGSGLSRSIKLSSKSLNALLTAGWDSDYRPEFLASFSLAGIDGTAKKRFRKSQDKGRIRIKTGYLRGVRTMATYLKNRSGRWVASNLLIEHPSVNFSIGNQIQDAFIEALVQQ